MKKRKCYNSGIVNFIYKGKEFAIRVQDIKEIEFDAIADKLILRRYNETEIQIENQNDYTSISPYSLYLILAWQMKEHNAKSKRKTDSTL